MSDLCSRQSRNEKYTRPESGENKYISKLYSNNKVKIINQLGDARSLAKSKFPIMILVLDNTRQQMVQNVLIYLIYWRSWKSSLLLVQLSLPDIN